jgi:hypothetical protein
VGPGFGVGILDMNEVSCLCREYDCDSSDQVITLLTVCPEDGPLISRWENPQYGMRFYVIFLGLSMQMQT